MSRRALIVANWKMNAPEAPRAFVDAIAAEAKTRSAEALICPPFTLISSLAGNGVGVGAQDCHAEASGAHTGDLSAGMLAAAGANCVIVGHSERRAAYGETDADVAAKAAAAQRAGMTAIVCIGETAEERSAGAAIAAVTRQAAASVPPGAAAANLVVAYEPVWAIGSGETPTPGEVARMHAAIRAELAARLSSATAADARILYGGSVSGANAADFFAHDGVDGALVGGASLKSESFLAILAAAE